MYEPLVVEAHISILGNFSWTFLSQELSEIAGDVSFCLVLVLSWCSRVEKKIPQGNLGRPRNRRDIWSL